MKKNRSQSAVDRIGKRVTGTVETVVATGVRWRGMLFDADIFHREAIRGVTVISVGNIAMGGRGKTPLSQAVAVQVATWGYRVTLLLRGYRGAREHRGGLVSHGDGPLMSLEDAGDEAYAAACLTRNVSVRVGANRTRQAYAARADGAEVVVLDDGFQHRQLDRHLDIVCVAPRDVTTGRLFPLGDLRESPQGLARAHVVVGYESDWHKWPQAGGVANVVPSVMMRPEPHFFLGADGERILPEQLGHSTVQLLSGIGVPQRFVDSVEALGMRVVSHRIFGDHHVYGARDLMEAASRSPATAVITTTKDYFKLLPLWPTQKDRMPLFALVNRVTFTRGTAYLRKQLADCLVSVHGPARSRTQSKYCQ